MPPTLAAARNTASGLACASQPSTLARSVRSSWPRSAIRTVEPSDASRRTMAEPTMPPCPATNTRPPRNSKGIGLIAGLIISVATDSFASDRLEIGINHLAHERVERHLVVPAELGPRLGRRDPYLVD